MIVMFKRKKVIGVLSLSVVNIDAGSCASRVVMLPEAHYLNGRRQFGMRMFS
jgi:hypothetical protein